MANSGQPGDFFGENVGVVDLLPYMNSGIDYDPTDTWNVTELLASPLNPSMETVLGSQQHGQPAGTNHQISVSGQPSSDQTNINVQTTPTAKMTPEQKEKRKEINRKSREKKKNEEIEMKDKLKKFEDEMKKLRIEKAEWEHAKVSMEEDLQSVTAVRDELKNNFENLKQECDEAKALYRELLLSHFVPKLTLKEKDLRFIKEGDKHDMKPTQYQSSSDEKGHSEKEISAGNLDGGDSEDDNDYKKKKKRAACSASSEGRSGKVPKFACYDARADRVVDPYSITECLRILKTMGDIPYSIAKKATAKFKSPDERETFVGLTADWKREWVKDLENDA